MYINRVGGSNAGKTVIYQVSAGGDDGEWYTWSSTKYFSATAMDVGYSSPNYYNAWARFLNINIPGAIILDARLKVYQSDTDAAKINIYANDAADAANPTDYDTAEAKTKTTAYVGWTLPGAAGWATSPNLKDVFQELIDSYTYSGSTDIMLLLRGSNDVSAVASMNTYDTDPTYGAYLEITYR